MSGLLGNIDHFDPEVEDWTQYAVRVGQFFEANGMGEGKFCQETVDILVRCGTGSIQVAVKYFSTS